jgi:hypothetical protein
MAVQIKASPKIRVSKSRAPKAQDAKPKFVVQNRAEAPPPRRGAATRILKTAFVLFLLAAGANALWSKIQGPDPHFLTAKKLVLDYEYGKPISSRNYEHVAYHQALAELSQVNPKSQSAEPAETMHIELERNIAAFREQQEKINKQLSTTRVKSRKKKQIEAQARLHSQLVPQTEFPECEEEGMGNTGGEHKH